MSRPKKQYPENFRSLAGFSAVVFSNTFATTVLSIFMMFITDYSGIDSFIGKVGFAATFATIFLLITRIIDAVDDPIQGWIMDNAKEIKFGKYRRFGIIGTVLITVGVIMLFLLPDAIKSNAVLLWIWCLIGYIVMEMGTAMSITSPILQKATTDARVRTKITSVIRFAIVIAAIPATFFVPIATAVAGEGGDLGAAATKVAVLFALVFAAITFIGVALLKEPYRPTAKNEEKKNLGFKEIFSMLKGNKLVWIHNIAFFVGDLQYAISSAVMAYFMKWYFCADLTTGAVDQVAFASLTGMFAIVTLLPNFLSPLLASFTMKFTKTVDRGMRFCMGMISVCFLATFILAVTGILKTMPIVFLILYFLIMLPSGMSSIFALLINIDCADYAEYTTGKNMTAITNSIYNVSSKAKSALGGVIPGILLMMVGYSVDSATGAYQGDLSALPGMVTGLSVVAALIPAILSFVCVILYKKFYKLTNEQRAEITAELDKRHAEQAAVTAE